MVATEMMQRYKKLQFERGESSLWRRRASIFARVTDQLTQRAVVDL